MHKRLGTFTGHLASVGKKLDSSVKSYNDAIASLESRVMPNMRKIKELGADSGRETEEAKTIDITARELKLIAADLKPEIPDTDLSPEGGNGESGDRPEA
jgi:DNA recombination protein RmuC